MGKDGAACFHSSSDASRDIPKLQWDTERFGMVCTKSDTLASWKASIQKLCSQTKNCVFPKELAAFFNKVDTHAYPSR